MGKIYTLSEWADLDIRQVVQDEKDRLERERKRNYAISLVHQALKHGELVKGPCDVGFLCAGDIQAHHPDYDEPLTVLWLCDRHHKKLHTAMRLVDPVFQRRPLNYMGMYTPRRQIAYKTY